MKKSYANMSRSKAAKRGIRSFIVKTSRWSCFEGFGVWGFDTPQLAAGSIHWALEGKKRQEPPTPCTLDGEAEAQWIALRLGKPPSGYGHWTLHLLADEMVRLELVDALRYETVRKVLKKTA